MRWLLRLAWRDWSRAPISGTAMLCGLVAAALAFPTDRGLLYLILVGVIGNGRDPMPPEGE